MSYCVNYIGHHKVDYGVIMHVVIMARPASTLYDQLTCSVCLERYKDPRTLPCHHYHSFCRVCLERVPTLEQADEQHEVETVGHLASGIK